MPQSQPRPRCTLEILNVHGEVVPILDEGADGCPELAQKAGGVVINPAGYGHTSIALLDSLLAAGLPTIEVHLSNIFAREAFRHHSYVSRAARGVICGLGPQGYRLALAAMAEILKTEAEA